MMNVAVGNAFDPFDIVNAVHFLNEHGQPFQTVGNFTGNGFAVDAAELLEVSKLGNFHAVEPDFPAETPGADVGAFPVIFHQTDIVFIGVDADGTETVHVEFHDIFGRRF